MRDLFQTILFGVLLAVVAGCLGVAFEGLVCADDALPDAAPDALLVPVTAEVARTGEVEWRREFRDGVCNLIPIPKKPRAQPQPPRQEADKQAATRDRPARGAAGCEGGKCDLKPVRKLWRRWR